jgi:hypothetical protein
MTIQTQQVHSTPPLAVPIEGVLKDVGKSYVITGLQSLETHLTGRRARSARQPEGQNCSIRKSISVVQRPSLAFFRR